MNYINFSKIFYTRVLFQPVGGVILKLIQKKAQEAEMLVENKINRMILAP